MSKLFIIVERQEDWTSYYPSEDVVTAQEYLELPIDDDTGKRVQVINLCRHYKYLRHGYYCSLLAEARVGGGKDKGGKKGKVVPAGKSATGKAKGGKPAAAAKPGKPTKHRKGPSKPKADNAPAATGARKRKAKS